MLWTGREPFSERSNAMVVIVFRSRLREDIDMAALEALGGEMAAIASAMPGFLSYKDYAAADGELLTLVEFESEERLAAWRDYPDHRAAQERGRREFFSEYQIQICSPLRAYRFGLAEGRQQIL
jgi:heme-degrading monooxygenase HmoA